MKIPSTPMTGTTTIRSAALYSVTFEGETDDPVSEEAMVQLRETLKDYDLSISSEVGEDGSARLEKEMQSILVVAAITILVVLFLTSRTYGEIPVLLLTFVAAALLNKGTNYLLGEISFISDSIAVVLQLALAIDYAIILCHRFSEEKETADTRTACILALSKAIPEISSSCLTTLAGLAAMMFMQFGIGMDLGVVLIKAVLFSILSVFTLMPGLLMLFSKLIERTPHKSFIPKITVWGRFVTSLKYITPPLFVIAFAAAAYLAGKCPYSYGTNTVKTEKKNETEIARENIDNVFGSQNTLAVVVPAGDYETEERLLKRLSAFPQVDTALGLANVEVKDGYVLTDALTPRQFSELTDMDMEVCRLFYKAYAADREEYVRIINNIDVFKVPIIDMFQFLYQYVGDGYLDQGYITLDDDTRSDLDDLNKQINDAKEQLQSEKYSRMLLNLALPEEGQETFAFLDTLHEVIGGYYPAGSFYLVGNSTSDYDLASSFSTTIRSSASDHRICDPGAFIHLHVRGPSGSADPGDPGKRVVKLFLPHAPEQPRILFGYLIVSSIQMGANIDYAIVISSRYQELKNKMPRREAMIETLNLSFPTVFTSGTIMASAGIFISKMTTDPAIYAVGLCIGRGTIISMLLVMGILPGILLLGDTIIDRTTFNIKYPAIVQTTEAVGMVRLDGRIRGTVSGKIDAEVHGVLMGDVSAVISAGNPDAVKAIGELPDGEDPGSLEEKPDENEKNTEKGENDHEA
ncbi:MAG: MMPL family transporter [Enterocloster sp.]